MKLDFRIVSENKRSVFQGQDNGRFSNLQQRAHSTREGDT